MGTENLQFKMTHMYPHTEVDAARKSALFIGCIAFGIEGHVEWNLGCVPSAKKENEQDNNFAPKVLHRGEQANSFLQKGPHCGDC
jgi:hypothetical protein